ncbi:MAG: sigma-54-dependent transcriptional regulator [Natronospirillum sp.]|uniref:sigma-54-dependent transcriptional regulator n=1 Tax=Natronospirillum sp. TaxID=2812955 RepID=UPI0025DD0FAB|nr:sigma-54-dependent transcriptional regulator [Natronospirillum sp.]MCH8552405.1 sigma-54-dependent transcriptional regulator [Natronospirillum sp.]
MRIRIQCEDRLGIAQEVLEILVSHEIDLKGIETESDFQGEIFLSLPSLQFETFQKIMPELRHIAGVHDVSTVAFMPMEREKEELNVLLATLPEPVISVDTSGRILVSNKAAQAILHLEAEELRGRGLRKFLRGFNLGHWLKEDQHKHQSAFVQMSRQAFLMDVYPIYIPDDQGEPQFAGAVLTFKSPMKLGRQIEAYSQTQSELSAMVADSKAMREQMRQARRMAVLDAPILITGETGTGKDLLARACHNYSLRREKPFAVLNCASLPESSAETELFGVAEGALPGVSAQEGIFARYDGGTVFLDEVGALPNTVQAKFLRLLHEGRFRKLGGQEEQEVDIRIICSSQQDLQQKVGAGEFRQDLFYRINVLNIHLPPLRERRADIEPLARHFVQRLAETSRRFVSLSDDAVKLLKQQSWPGNVRELENTLYRAVSLVEEDVIMPEHLGLPPVDDTLAVQVSEFTGTLESSVKEFEAKLLRALYPSYPSSRQLGKRLGLSHTAVANKLREYNIGRRR